MHPSAPLKGASSTGDDNLVAHDRQVAWQRNLTRLLIEPLPAPRRLDFEHKLDPPELETSML